MRTLLTLAPLAALLGACAPLTVTVRPPTYNVTVDNRACLTTATVFIDDRNVGTVPGRGLRSFPVTPGQHTINVDNDIFPQERILVENDMTWKGGLCL